MERTFIRIMGAGTSTKRLSCFNCLVVLICVFPLLFCLMHVICLTQEFVHPAKKIERWAVVNFSSKCDPKRIATNLSNVGKMKGVVSDT